jgi:colanic acid/amylovoran biosynthesis glycosyltransferase
VTAARIAYLVPRFPKLSETFVADEMTSVERRGATIELYALLAGRELPPSTPARWSAIVASVPRALAAQLYWLVCRPLPLLQIWRSALSRHRSSPKRFAQALLSVGAAGEFALRMRRSRVAHVHAHFATHSALAAWAIGRLTGIPYSFTVHADDIFIRRPMLEEKVGESSFVVAISEFNRRFLVEQLGVSAGDRIRVIHCGVDSSAFAPLPPPKEDAPFTILCVGRLEPKKGQRHLLEACRELADRGIEFRCWLVGEGRERAALERARDALGLADRVELLGACPRERVRELMAEAHVFALPSVVAEDGRAEGIPVALMEAMAMQRPVVSARISGIPELIESGRSGLLVAPGDPAALADALERIHGDPLGAAQMAREAVRVIRERFDVDDSARRLLGLIRGGAER